jgi:hypothetical protein
MRTTLRWYEAAVVAPGLGLIFWGSVHWDCPNIGAWLCYALFSAVVSCVSLPGTGRAAGWTGGGALGMLAVLAGMNWFSGPEVLAAAVVAAAAGALAGRDGLEGTGFAMANAAVSAGSSLLVLESAREQVAYYPALFSLVTAQYFALHTLVAAGRQSLAQGERLTSVLSAGFRWNFVYYLAGATVLGVASSGSRDGWLLASAVLVLVAFFRRVATRPSTAAEAGRSNGVPVRLQVFVGALALAALTLLAAGLAQWEDRDPVRLGVFLAVAGLASGFKVRLPNMTGTISTNFVVILFAAVELAWLEAMLVAVVAAVVQSYWRARTRPKAIQVIFNAANLVASVSLAHMAAAGLATVPAVITATAVYYGCNSVLVCTVLGLLERRSFGALWKNCQFWSAPFFVAGTAASGMMVFISRTSGYPHAFLVLTLMSLVFLAYRAHVQTASGEMAPARAAAGN